MRSAIPLLLAAAIPLAAPAQQGASTTVSVPSVTFPSGQAQTVNIVDWDGGDLPPIYERTDQLPVTEAEVVKLGKVFEAAKVAKIIEQRRCACDASADGLIRLKEAGVPEEVVMAVSTHALPPNRALNLHLTLDFSGESTKARDGFLYVFIDDGKLTRVFTANLRDLLGRRWAHETNVDDSDLLIARTVRRIELAGAIPLKTYGPHKVLVATSANPSLIHPSQLAPRERQKAQVYELDYPRASIQNVCRLNVGYKLDPVLDYKWHYQGSRFECEWN